MHEPADDDQKTLDELQKLGYEVRDVPVKKMPMHAGALYAFVGLVMIVSWLFMSIVDRDLTTVPSAESMERSRQPDEGFPVIQGGVTAKTDIEDLRKAERIGTTTSTWIDEEAGVARIPIDVAIQLKLKEGFDTQAREQTVPARPTIEIDSTDDEPEPGAETDEAPSVDLMPAEEDE